MMSPPSLFTSLAAPFDCPRQGDNSSYYPTFPTTFRGHSSSFPIPLPHFPGNFHRRLLFLCRNINYFRSSYASIYHVDAIQDTHHRSYPWKCYPSLYLIADLFFRILFFLFEKYPYLFGIHDALQ